MSSNPIDQLPREMAPVLASGSGKAVGPHDTSFHALRTLHRRESAEAEQGEGLSDRSAYLLPLAISLSRLAARRHASELVQP